MENTSTRQKIISAGSDLIAIHGYNATGLSAILKRADVPKGSFYHYFKSKEDFGLAVLEHVVERYEQRLAVFLDDDEIPPLDRIRNYLENGLLRLSQNQCAKGCLIGNLGQEMADVNERFRARLDRFFQKRSGYFALCLRQALGRGELALDMEADLVAGFILFGWDGSILRSKVMQSPQPMRDFIDVLFMTMLKRS